ncbi:hypothetical protein IFM89_039315 [Coptis chinensis]|uniref:Transcription termination and cleavage factor C-terminal domain-containing protein n=1 Tax=Coptis chinensis TaxID=261450 RepID=A0A835HQK0_9MAGN|nr:hypothetical protein IFM89_039315 [Coptis chinensis]
MFSLTLTHHSLIPRPLLSQPNFQQQPGSSNSMTTFGLPEIGNNNYEKSSEVTNETRWVPGSNSNLHLGVLGQTGMTRNNMEPARHPSKLAKLEDGRSAIRTMVSQNTNTASESGPSPEMVQNSNDQMLQLAPEVQSALLEQVKSLTPEQLRSLPPEQRQQVIDLQKMLR